MNKQFHTAYDIGGLLHGAHNVTHGCILSFISVELKESSLAMFSWLDTQFTEVDSSIFILFDQWCNILQYYTRIDRGILLFIMRDWSVLDRYVESIDYSSSDCVPEYELHYYVLLKTQFMSEVNSFLDEFNSALSVSVSNFN